MKAQTATEYIIILAVVLILAGIVLSSLGKLPTIGSSTNRQHSQRFWQTADIAIVAAAFTNDNSPANDSKLTLVNNFPTVIEIQAINISSKGSDTEDIALSITPFTLSPGEEAAKEANLNTNNPCYQRTSEDSFSVAIVFKYEDVQTQKTYYYRGASTKLQGTCADSFE